MWFVSRMLVAVLAGAVVLATNACGGTSESGEFEFRIYDPAGTVATEITTADIVRSSAGLMQLENVRAMVYVDFTDSGTSRFCRLTRALAHRGRTLRKSQPIAIEVNGRERSRSMIDHVANPEGFCAAPGIRIDDLPLVEADVLVKAIRG